MTMFECFQKGSVEGLQENRLNLHQLFEKNFRQKCKSFDQFLRIFQQFLEHMGHCLNFFAKLEKCVKYVIVSFAKSRHTIVEK